VGRHASPVRARVEDHERDADRRRLAAALSGDARRQPPLPIERPEQLVDVDDGRLELDDQERGGPLVPSHDVDDPALAQIENETSCWACQARCRRANQRETCS
jgi:hypothetical protein